MTHERLPRSVAAEAFIVERTGKIAKTHSGLRAEFARLARGVPEIDRAFSVFLAQAYKYKEISDYGVGPGAVITMAEADEAAMTGTHGRLRSGVAWGPSGPGVRKS